MRKGGAQVGPGQCGKAGLAVDPLGRVPRYTPHMRVRLRLRGLARALKQMPSFARQQRMSVRPLPSASNMHALRAAEVFPAVLSPSGGRNILKVVEAFITS